MSSRFHNATGSVIKYAVFIVLFTLWTYIFTPSNDFITRIIMTALATAGAVIIMVVFERSGRS